MELGNELHASRVSLQRFHTLLSQRLPFLRHIQVNALLVVDHLGRNIPVPTQFCSTWEVSFVWSLCPQIIHLVKLEFPLRLQRLLQTSVRGSLHRTWRLSSATCCRQSNYCPLAIRKRGRVGNGSRNQCSLATAGGRPR
jgi:hypothetical protein